MSKVGETIRKHHEELRKNLSSMVLALVEGKPEADPKALVDFLKGDLLPHAVGEELHLYPEVEALIKTHGQATATMSIDHEFISGYIRQIEEAAKAFENASAKERPAAERQLHRLALQMEALLRVHLDKEERVYIPLFEKHLSDKEQQRVLEGMHAAYEGDVGNVKAILDVRQLPPPQRHPLIFQTFEALQPGGDFILINDHDPKPLYYQFKFERKGQFTWEYLEQGPDVWRVRIAKKSSKRRAVS